MRAFLFFLASATLLAPAPALHAAEAAPAVAFPGAQGNYGGIVATNDSNYLTAGALAVVLEPTGSFSAKFFWEGLPYPFIGHFDAGTATFQRQFHDHSEAGSELVLGLTLDASSRIINCTLDVQNGGSVTLSATGMLSGTLPDASVGQTYGGTMNTTFIDPPGYGNTPQDIPGEGFSIVRISKAKGNRASIVGRLPDTTPFAGSSVLRGTAYNIYSPLYRSAHGVGGQVFGSLDASDPTSLIAVFPWAKRAGADPHYYTAGFNTGVGLLTMSYSKSVELHEIPHISTTPGPVPATLTLTDGNLGQVNNVDVVLTAQIKIGFFGVKILPPNPQHIVVTTNAPAGTWAGTFVHPVSGRLTGFHGAFQQAHNNMNGEGKGNFKGSVPPNSMELPESGTAQITVN